MRWRWPIALACAIGTAHGAELQLGVGYTGQYGTSDREPQAQRLRASAMIEQAFGKRSRLHVEGRLEYDSEDRLEPGEPAQDNRAQLNRRLLLGERGNAELREAYLDTRAGSWDLRLGKQQIVWGTSDGIKMLDLVNPQSLREFIVEDFERSRIPLWTLRAARPVGDRGELELIAIPDLSFHDIPRSDALFAPRSPRLAPQGAVLPDSLSLISARLLAGLEGQSDASPTDPLLTLLQPLIADLGGVVDPLLPQTLRDRLAPRIVDRTERPQLDEQTLEIGARWRTTLGEVDLALIALRHFNDVPSVRVEVSPGVERIDAVRHPLQTHTYGLQSGWPLGAWLLRGEFLHSRRAPLPALDLPDDDLDARAPLVSALVGLDRSVRSAGLVSVQWTESRLQRDSGTYDVPDRQRYVTALWRDEIIPGRLGFEWFGILETQDGDSLLRLRSTWMLRDWLEGRAGLDLFSGRDDGVFGQFDRLDRISLELNWAL